MTNEEQETEPQKEPDVEINLATPDEVAYSELCEKFGNDLIIADLEEVIKQRVRSLYDNQDEIEKMIAQAQAQEQR